MAFLKPIKKKVNGKLIVMDFKYINPKDIVSNYDLTKKQLLDEYAAFGPDGKLYINSRKDDSDLLVELFEILMQEKICTLEQYKSMCRNKYKEITLDNISEFNLSGSDLIKAFAGLLVPIEMSRRKIEKSYYEKI